MIGTIIPIILGVGIGYKFDRDTDFKFFLSIIFGVIGFLFGLIGVFTIVFGYTLPKKEYEVYTLVSVIGLVLLAILFFI